MGLILRKADINDADIILEWRNDKVTRNNSFTKELLDPAGHLIWFRGKLSDESCFMFILMDGSEKIGYLRIDCINSIGRISYIIAPCKRNKGYGKKIIGLSESVMPDNVKALAGFVNNSNEPSKKCFIRNGYTELAAGDISFYIKLL